MMNTIVAQMVNSIYDVYDDYLNIRIDDFWLDEKLDELYPNNEYKGLIPTLLFAMETEEERDVVLNRIKPDLNTKSICPILMCPDDCDFSCTLVVVEIEALENSIKWNRFGVDQTLHYDAIKVGSNVEWFSSIGSYEFSISDYNTMIAMFEKQYIIDESNSKL